MEYTKGEWEYKEGEYNHHDDKKWCNTGSIKAKDKEVDGWFICRIDDIGEANIANAHLIAAAPDLYEALKALMLNDKPSWTDDLSEYWQNALNAIEKAEGRRT